jgi:hypothetical protein
MAKARMKNVKQAANAEKKETETIQESAAEMAPRDELVDEVANLELD